MPKTDSSAQPASNRRSYNSPRRRASAEDTRRAVLDAATELFTTRGWSATGMRDIARRAEVSVETVYATAGTKTDLLLRVIDVALVGDAEPIPVSARAEFLALGIGELADRAGAAADLLTAQFGRVALLERTLAHAAAADPDLAVRQRALHERRRVNFRQAAALVLGREPDPDLVDGLWAVGSPDVYLLLVENSGWTPQRYRDWIADAILRLLGPDPRTAVDTPPRHD
ncbi:TetR/AcrR family transcriptional regulator [Rhodococcus zopfii]|uniref:TetR/AcrR family transcriptional regulator n=1 Tax=Rhodococcus zopfii TaxID=43772 RepID=A0ABU3WLV1_9NOCA|nr:TetR/AcrR family transcriptional regulator [Rhodococcus zopfii]